MKVENESTASSSWVPFVVLMLVGAYLGTVIWSVLSVQRIRVELRNSVLELPDIKSQALGRVQEAYRFMGLPPVHVAQGPRMVLNVENRHLIGYDAIAGYLKASSEQSLRFKGATFMALTCLLFVVLRSLPIGRVFHPLSLASPFLAACFSIPMVSRCETCQVTADRFEIFTKFGLIVLPLLLGISIWTCRGRLACRIAVILCGSVLCAEVLLLIHSPKFCIYCLLITLSIISSMFSLLEPHRFLLVRKGLATVSLSLAAFWGVSVASAMGYISQDKAQIPVEPVSFVGTPISRYFSPNGGVDTKIILVTIEGCGSCENADKQLKSAGITYVKKKFCGTLQATGCFDAGSGGMAPLILVVDRSGMVIFQHEGWPASQDLVDDLIRTLKTKSSGGKS